MMFTFGEDGPRLLLFSPCSNEKSLSGISICMLFSEPFALSCLKIFSLGLTALRIKSIETSKNASFIM